MPRGIRITQVLVVGAMGLGAAGQTSLAAQDSQEQSERPVTTTQRLDGDVTLTLPIDSVSQGLSPRSCSRPLARPAP